MNVEELARRVFMRRCELDAAEPALAELAWTTDPGLRAFWVAEARFVMDLLEGDAA